MNTTEQERAEFLSHMRSAKGYKEKYFTWDVDGFHNKVVEASFQGWCACINHQATRRAPVVPQGWRLVPVEPTNPMEQAAADYLDACVKAHGLWMAMLAAAPQPPEADIGNPMSQQNQPIAAPVQLPDPVAYWRTGATDVLHNFCYHAVKSPHWQPLYTEQQVHQLLAAQEQST